MFGIIVPLVGVWVTMSVFSATEQDDDSVKR